MIVPPNERDKNSRHAGLPVEDIEVTGIVRFAPEPDMTFCNYSCLQDASVSPIKVGFPPSRSR